jgi:hypothetical protein
MVFVDHICDHLSNRSSRLCHKPAAAPSELDIQRRRYMPLLWPGYALPRYSGPVYPCFRALPVAGTCPIHDPRPECSGQAPYGIQRILSEHTRQLVQLRELSHRPWKQTGAYCFAVTTRKYRLPHLPSAGLQTGQGGRGICSRRGEYDDYH